MQKPGGKLKMNSPYITAAKMICKSIDALTREIYLLRTEKDKTYTHDGPEENQIPPLGIGDK